MAAITQQEIIRRAEKIREYHKFKPTAAERLHINRGRQLMYDLLKDVFGDPLIAPGKAYKGDWEMLFTQVGSEAVITAIGLQQQQTMQKTTDEQQRKIEVALLRLAQQTSFQLKAMLLDTAADHLTLKKPGEISTEGLIRRIENDLAKGPTPPEGQQPFTWQTTFEQQGVPGLQAWVNYEMNVAEYQLNLLNQSDKPDKNNFETIIVRNKINYLKQVLNHLNAMT